MKAVINVGIPIRNEATIGMPKKYANQVNCSTSLISVRIRADMPNAMILGFPIKRRSIPPPIPIMPIIAAIKGVQGPGIMNRSETTIISAPVMNPCNGPNTKPHTKAKVSVKPIFTKTPYTLMGDAKATHPNPILKTAPVDTKSDIAESCFVGIFNLILYLPIVLLDG